MAARSRRRKRNLRRGARRQGLDFSRSQLSGSSPEGEPTSDGAFASLPSIPASDSADDASDRLDQQSPGGTSSDGEEPDLSDLSSDDTDIDSKSPEEEAEEEGKLTKEDVGYGFPPPFAPMHVCERCVHFNTDLSCDVVVGEVSPNGWCVEWEEDKMMFGGLFRKNIGDIHIETTTSGNIGTGPDIALGQSSSARGKTRRSPRDPMVKKLKKRKKRKK